MAYLIMKVISTAVDDKSSHLNLLKYFLKIGAININHISRCHHQIKNSEFSYLYLWCLMHIANWRSNQMSNLGCELHGWKSTWKAKQHHHNKLSLVDTVVGLISKITCEHTVTSHQTFWKLWGFQIKYTLWKVGGKKLCEHYFYSGQ